MNVLANTAPVSTAPPAPPFAAAALGAIAIGHDGEPPKPTPNSSDAAQALLAAFEQFKTRIAAYLKPEDLQRVVAAYHFANTAHEGQLRVSGEAYISHPLAVASNLAGWHLDPQALIAALLHDVMEDTAITTPGSVLMAGRV